MKAVAALALAFLLGYILAIQDCSTDACNRPATALRRLG